MTPEMVSEYSYDYWKEKYLAAEATLAEKEAELTLNAKMLARQCYMARDAETKTAEYKGKLYLILRTLGVENIEELMEKPSPYLVKVALVIFEAAKRYGDAETKMGELLGRFLATKQDFLEVVKELAELRVKNKKLAHALKDCMSYIDCDNLTMQANYRDSEISLRDAVDNQQCCL